MLTNNKKSYFVKSIAMIMAVLMVLAVALTGCGNKAAEEAATKAENAQNTANEAKTAAQAVTDALKDYLKITDGVKADALNAIIQDALGEFKTSLELSTFVKNDDAFKALTDKVATVYVKSEVDAAITAAVAGKITSAEAQALVDALGTTVAEDIAEAVAGLAKTADLGAYLKSAEWQTKFDASFSAALTAAKAQFNYLTASDLDGIKASVNNVYTKTEVDNALGTAKTALETKINGLDTKITTALANYYVKAEVDAMMATLNEKDATMAAQIAQLQEIVYQILNAFLPQEKAETLTDENVDFGELLKDWDASTIAGAIADKWSLEEWNTTTPEVIKAIAGIKELLDDLYDGEWVDDDQSDDTPDVFVADKAYTKANKDAINAALAPLNITIFDEDYNVADYDTVAQTLEYAFLRAANMDDLATMQAAVEAAKNVPHFAEELEAVVDTIFTIGHKHGDDQYVKIEDVAAFNAFTFAYDALLSKYLFDDAFAGTKLAGTYGKVPYMTVWQNPADANVFHLAAADATEYKVGDVAWTKYTAQPITILGSVNKTSDDPIVWKTPVAYGICILPNTLTDVFDWANEDNVEQIEDSDYHGGTVTLAADATEATNVYAALLAQLGECYMAIDDAKEVFADFLEDTVKEYGVLSNGTALKTADDIDYDDYLEALTIEMCTAIENGLEDILYLNGEVTEAMNVAIARNTCEANTAPSQAVIDAINADGTTDDDYALYNAMKEKVAGELFLLYQDYAQELLQKIVEDYLSIVETVVALTGFDATNVVDAITLDDEASDFLKAYFNDDETFTGWSSTATETDGALSVDKGTFKALIGYYTEINGDAGENYLANPVVTIQNNAEELNLFLKAAVIGVRDSIYELTLEAAVAEEYPRATAYEIFEDRLAIAVANLDEVYARFLFEDFKNVLVNDLYDYATETANLFSEGYNDPADLIAAMQAYLVGTTEGDSTLFPNNGLTNGSLASELDNYVVNTHTGITAVLEIEDIAAQTEEALLDMMDGFATKLDNMAIKYNFLQYLEEATLNLQEAYVIYRSIPGVRLALNAEVDATYNVADAHITMTKFQDQFNVIGIDDYIAKYSEVLGLIFDSTDANQVKHVEKLFGEDAVATELAKIKSDDAVTSATGANEIKKPANYNFLGSVVTGTTDSEGNKVKGFDEIVNTDAKFVKADGTTESLYK